MRLLKHVKNTDVAFQITERMKFGNGCELWQGRWWNVVQEPFPMDEEEKIHIERCKLHEWKEIEAT